MESILPLQRRVLLSSGLISISALLTVLFANLFLPLSSDARFWLWIVLIAVFVISGVNHLILYFISREFGLRFALVPDLLYILLIGIASAVATPYSYLFSPFFLLAVTIEAFILPSWQYILLVFTALISSCFSLLFWLNPIPGFEAVIMLFSAVAMRLINVTAMQIKTQDETLKSDIQKLENDKREIRTLLESISDGMFVVDGRNKISFVNKSALKILNIISPAEKILGRDIGDFLPTIGKDGPEPVTRDAFGNYQNSIRDDLRIVRSDKVLQLHTNVTPVVSEKDTLQGAIIFFRDITGLKKLDEERAEFNAVASHELRTPLTVIEGYLYFILDPDSGAKYNKVTKEYVEKAHDASQDLIHLVSDILTVVKSEDNDLVVTIEKVDLEALIASTIKGLAKKASAKKIKLLFKITSTKTIPVIMTDKVKVKEILTNLVDNAIKFTEKGSVTVELGMLEKEVIISVADTGPGITPADQKRVFQKFFRSEDYKTRKTGGTGLGLYISKTLTERLGGRVGLQSVPKMGSRFYFTLPISEDVIPQEPGTNKSDILKQKEEGFEANNSGR